MPSDFIQVPADLGEARKLWLEKYRQFSGLPVPYSTPFIPQAEKLLKDYQDLIRTNQDNHDLLLRLLPDMADRIPPPKPTVILTDGQQHALSDLEKWLKTGESYFVLRGYAGTGKTFIVKEFAKLLYGAPALYTAPTNKATKVLRMLMDGALCKTIYSALSLRMTTREDELVLTASEEKFNIGKYKIVVVDEASMLNTEIMSHLEDACRRFGIKVLFVCDPCQLPPVGEDISPVMALDCPTFELTEVVRHDNQILELATSIRNSILTGARIAPISFDSGSEKSVWQLSDHGFYERCRKMARNGFNDVKIVAWRNRTVDSLNNLVRDELYTEEQRDFGTWLIGDSVVMTEPVGSGKNTVATTDDEGIISESDIDMDAETGLKCYHLSVKMEDGTTIMIRTIHEDGMSNFQQQLGELAAQARKPGQRSVWKTFWGLKNRFINIRHSWALTAHRAQGSTFKRVLVDAGDILSNSDSETAKRCLYVATTRPSKHLFLNGFPR